MQDKLTAANTPEELIKAAKEMGYDLTVEEAAETIAKAKAFAEAEGKLEDEHLTAVNGGSGVTDLPEFGTIKSFYKAKGINSAITLCLYYYKSDVCYEMIQLLGEQI